MSSAGNVEQAAGSGEQMRYLVDIVKLTPNSVKVRILHLMTKRFFDLKPLNTVVTLRLPDNSYDSVMKLCMDTKPAVVDVVDGQVVNAMCTDDAEIIPVEKVHLEMDPADADNYATIYSPAATAKHVRDFMMSLNFHWSHELSGVVHLIPISDALELRTSHCQHCAELKFKRTVNCVRCNKITDPMYSVVNELLGKAVLALKGVNPGGKFTAVNDMPDSLTLHCNGFDVKTNTIELQNLLERALVSAY
ncbi:MAG: hypothetical protein JRN62_04270 [Nitrososphaerota archaeon]|nr:hypothetical protein [Nitrososphaerota archaeon]MDG6948819.1 hypothetical protein [Nitrososphaerota archaeon]